MKKPQMPDIRVPNFVRRPVFWIGAVIGGLLVINGYLLYGIYDRLPPKPLAQAKSLPTAKNKK